MTGCRISKVTYKKSNLVEVIPKTPRPWHKHMHEDVDRIMSCYKDDMASYVIVAIDLDGSYSTTFQISPKAFFGRTLLPVVVMEVLRKDTLTGMI